MTEWTLTQGLRLKYALEVLAETPDGLRGRELWARVVERVPLTGGEAEPQGPNLTKGQNVFLWQTVDLVKAGWIVKAGRWRITGPGRRALRLYRDPERLYAVKTAAYSYWEDHKEAFDAAVKLIEAVPDDSWVSVPDLAEFMGIDDAERLVAYLQGTRPPGWHRVLDEDGSLPGTASLTDEERTAWLGLLYDDGIDVGTGHADHAARLPGPDLRQLSREEPTDPAPLKQVWLIRGSSVQGVNLVRRLWLPQGVCSLPATRLRRDLPPGSSRSQVQTAIDVDYAQASSHERARLVSAYHAFLSRMREGDLIVTNDGNDLFVGTITGRPGFVASADHRADLQRTVRWRNPERPFSFDDLPPEIYNRVSNPDDEVIDLSDYLGDLEALLGEEPEQPTTPQTFALPDATDELATNLLIDRDWLQMTIELLREMPQLIFYGPPGTGKTYLALALAEHLTGGSPESVQLVQFHPAYSYEDFVEGYRPAARKGGQVGFEIVQGPFLRLADAARKHPNRPYVLVIDEINRGALAKIFGELYFLLEYRERSVNLLYGSDEGKGFWLPKNLVIIGTMNTADRTIALIDSAMRRRFSFVELHPDEPPTRDLLGRWLEQRGIDGGETVKLLAELNARIDDRDFRIGPSYLMRESLYTGGKGLEVLWRSQILPLLEEHYYGTLQRDDVVRKYGLPALRRSVADTSG